MLTLLALGLFVLGAVLAYRIDVNEFSMHRFYRNRLVRAYLGASVDAETRSRLRQPFTGFYPGDDLELAKLEPTEKPFHIVNTALNLVSGEELAWQQRKAASFVLTPLYCGFDVRKEAGEDPAVARGDIDPNGYRPVRDYGSRPVRLTLGSALAISGAAASPNMGYHTTPAFSFLLTVFNVRLGWWLGNPRRKSFWMRSGPYNAIFQLFSELIGATHQRNRYVYLSDGGHFENLGIYELVRRRCRFVVACDAGADPNDEFEDLGNAIRKIRADFGIEIDLHVGSLRRNPDTGYSDWHCAIGKIRYTDKEHGLLLYIKASLTGDEPEDILNYKRQEKDFPHQSTGDQFFDESQFESYRRLGHHVTTKVLERAVARAKNESTSKNGVEPELLWLALEETWWPPRHAAEAFTRHTATLVELYELQRTEKNLHFLDAQFYPEWPRLVHSEERPNRFRATTIWLPAGEAERREGFYFCNSLIQLMENVYLDLDLENDCDHPDHRGWMNLFKHWTWSGMFRATWSISAATYGQRFQAFCRDRLDLDLGEVQIEKGALVSQTLEELLAGKTIEDDFLNFVEREQARLYGKYSRVTIGKVVQFRLTVRGDGGADPLLHFGFGYALLDSHDCLALFRIQDHLRQMGLGRRALLCLAEDIGPAGLRLYEEPKKGGAPKEGSTAKEIQAGGTADKTGIEAVFTAEVAKDELAAQVRFCREFWDGEGSLRALVDSVCRELESKKGGHSARVAAAGDPPKET